MSRRWYLWPTHWAGGSQSHQIDEENTVWIQSEDDGEICRLQTDRGCVTEKTYERARLIAVAPLQHDEMVRYLPILERAEADPEIWNKLTAGTGIATANGYRHAINQALGRKDE